MAIFSKFPLKFKFPFFLILSRPSFSRRFAAVTRLSPSYLSSLCCQCGVPIDPNPSATCVACLRTNVDITESIPKQVVVYFCRFCERYLNPPAQWVKAELESRELMALCLKRLKNLSKVKLVDANFVWTEPHSKRIKVKLTVQAEVGGAGTILQQAFIVEYVVNGQMCDECR